MTEMTELSVPEILEKAIESYAKRKAHQEALNEVLAAVRELPELPPKLKQAVAKVDSLQVEQCAEEAA